jgi:hypothetical protein
MGRHAKGRAGRAAHLRWVASSRAPCLVSWLSFLVLVFIPLCSQELVFCGSVWSMHLYCARCVVRAPFSCYERERERERCSVSVGGAGSSQPTMCASAFERRAPTFTKQKSPAFFLSSALFRVKRSSWPISAPPPRLRNSPLVFSIISETAVCLIAHRARGSTQLSAAPCILKTSRPMKFSKAIAFAFGLLLVVGAAVPGALRAFPEPRHPFFSIRFLPNPRNIGA